MSQTGLGIQAFVFDHASNLSWSAANGEVAPTSPANIVIPNATTSLATYVASKPSNSSTNWRLLGEIQSLDTSGPESAAVDFSSLNSFLNYKPFRRGQKDPGTLSLSLLYDTLFWPRILQLFSDTSLVGSGSTCYEASIRWWQVRIPAELCNSTVGYYWTVQGFAQNAPLSASGPDDPTTVDLEVKLSSPPLLQDSENVLLYPLSK